MLDAQRITLGSGPTMLARVLERHPAWTAPPRLRAILVGGAAASPKLLQRAADRHLPIVITYGCTETCSQVTVTPYAARFAAADWGAGMPLPGIDVRVTDGHIEVRGPVVMAGYWDSLPGRGTWSTPRSRRPSTRAAACTFRPRADLIVTGGENVYPAEVERTLEALPGIAAAGVFGVPDDVWGQTVAAALVAAAVPPSDAALYEYLTRQLAPHKRPRLVCYVDRLPQTPAHKLDRLALPGVAQSLRPLAPDDEFRR